MVGEKPVKVRIGNDDQPHLRLPPEQGPLLLRQDHVLVVKPEEGCILQSSFYEVGYLNIFKSKGFAAFFDVSI